MNLPRTFALRPLVLLSGSVLATTLLGCGSLPAVPIHMNVDTSVQNTDGTVTHNEMHFDSTLDQLPAQMSTLGDQLGDMTSQLVTKLTDVPPPGQITIKDLDPSFAKYKDDPKFDFISQAKDNDGKPITFQYVKLGVATYDDFFKTAQQIYALVYQGDQTVHRMVEIATAVLKTPVDPTNELQKHVDAAIAGQSQASADQATIDELKSLRDLGKTLGVIVPDVVKSVEKLVVQGRALVVGAPASLTKPSVVAHLSMVKDGLKDSVKVIKESGDILAKEAQELAGFVTS